MRHSMYVHNQYGAKHIEICTTLIIIVITGRRENDE